MSQSFRKSTLFAAAAAALALFPCAAVAQTKVEVDTPKFDNILSPEIAGGFKKSWKAKEWLEVEARIKVSMAKEPKSKTCDRLSVKWYVAVENPDKPGFYLKLSKEVQFVNIPLNEEVYVSVYLSPASIKRLTGFDRASKSSVKWVGFEVIADGQVVASETSGGKDKWWTMASEKISDTDTVPLLSKAETPFAAMCWDRYAEEKSLAAGSK